MSILENTAWCRWFPRQLAAVLQDRLGRAAAEAAGTNNHTAAQHRAKSQVSCKL